MTTITQYRQNYLIKCGLQFPAHFLSHFGRYMNDIIPNFTLLRTHNLPILIRPFDLAEFLEIDFITLLRYGSVIEEITPAESSYKIFPINKKSGGKRYIITPVDELKKIQKKIYENILLNVKSSRFAMGFIPTKSNIKNAELHCGFKVIYILDLKNFFPTIRFMDVFTMYKFKFGYSEVISFLLTILTTYLPRKYTNGKLKLLRNTEGILPQGAPTSPYISNLIFIELDYALYKLARRYNFEYSRYVDDITFSSKTRKIVPSEFRNKARELIQKSGFYINYQKEFISRKRQKITGIIAHESHLTLPRKWVKNLRAALHELRNMNCKKELSDIIISKLMNIQGRCMYAIGVNAEKYIHFVEEFHEILSSKFKYLFQEKNT